VTLGYHRTVAAIGCSMIPSHGRITGFDPDDRRYLGRRRRGPSM